MNELKVHAAFDYNQRYAEALSRRAFFANMTLTGAAILALSSEPKSVIVGGLLVIIGTVLSLLANLSMAELKHKHTVDRERIMRTFYNELAAQKSREQKSAN